MQILGLYFFELLISTVHFFFSSLLGTQPFQSLTIGKMRISELLQKRK